MRDPLPLTLPHLRSLLLAIVMDNHRPSAVHLLYRYKYIMPEDWLTTKEETKISGYHIETIRKLLNSGKLDKWKREKNK